MSLLKFNLLAVNGILRLHPSHQNPMRRVSFILLLLALGFFISWLMPAPTELKGIASYLPLHNFLEIISIIISVLIFAVGWNGNSRTMYSNIVLLAAVFFGVALLDFSHVISFKWMPDFVTPSDPEKAINFWLAARTFAAIALLAAVIIPWRASHMVNKRYAILGAVITITIGIYWIFLFHPEAIPRTFIQGLGLTAFKVNAEYALITINSLTALLLWRRMSKPQPYYAAMIFGAVSCMAMSEFFFTLYADVTDIYNLLGHIYKVAAYLFLYRAIFVETIELPFQRLHEAQQQLTLSINASNIGLWDWDIINNQVYFSPEWKSQLGYKDDELENSFATWESLMHPDDHTKVMQSLRDFLKSSKSNYHNEFRLRHKDNSYRWILAQGELRFDHNGKPIQLLGSHVDYTERKNAEAEIHNLAYFDPLTKLPNRRLFLNRFQLALLNSARSNKYGTVMFLDLDNFKTVNDTLGHSLGDFLLAEVAKRITGCVREEDTVARLGGDEFVVLIEGIDKSAEVTSKKVAQIAEKIHDLLADPYQISQYKNQTTASIGVALFRGTEKSADDILKFADMAMYKAKDSGRNAIRFFDPAMQLAIEAHTALEADLRLALLNMQLTVHYQIQADNHHQPVGVEALLRWQHPVRGMVSPAQFIPIAEETLLIIDIGLWVLKTAALQLLTWSKQEHTRHLSIAVNVSALQFKVPDFVNHVDALIKKFGINPALLKLELTESTVLGDVDDVIAKMHALKALGIKLSMDDFGTGYSSLSYLTRLPLNQLKIDQSFVREINIDHYDSVMVQTIIDMAKNFHLEVIAEGVETEEQFRFLEENDCLTYQGYYFGKPLPITELDIILNKNK
jgi:diguanylate cyclase (GGDEF)-like protein/PAS domain S-box-containing protein